MEVAKHEDVDKLLQCNSYYCNAYHSWGKGMVENNNGLIRRFLPKGTDFDNISEETIQRIENRINNRPMKVLGYKTPNEVFQELKKVS